MESWNAERMGKNHFFNINLMNLAQINYTENGQSLYNISAHTFYNKGMKNIPDPDIIILITGASHTDKTLRINYLD